MRTKKKERDASMIRRVSPIIAVSVQDDDREADYHEQRKAEDHRQTKHNVLLDFLDHQRPPCFAERSRLSAFLQGVSITDEARQPLPRKAQTTPDRPA